MVPLRAKVATIAAASFGMTMQKMLLTGYNETLTGPGARREIARNGSTMSGLDVLAAQKFQPLLGKRIGLITNHTGIDREGRRGIDLMRAAGVQIAPLYSRPSTASSASKTAREFRTRRTPLPDCASFSLYGETRRPTPEMLRGIDALVFDIQDVGARFYTYESTMWNAMEEAAKAKIPFYVLDRPNPITGTRVEGPLLDAANTSFVGSFAGLPVRHGLTMGELARLFNGENKLGADLRVISMQDWNRGDWLDSTNLPVDQSLAQHAQPEGGDTLSGPVPARIFEEPFRGPRYRRSVRTDRRRFHRRGANWRRI